jgi:acid ceramidase
MSSTAAVPRITVDLGDPPAERWRQLAPFKDQAQRMTASYLQDLGGADEWRPLVQNYSDAFISAPLLAEAESIAALIERPRDEVIISNLYYDAFRALMGCTAVAMEHPEGPLHARNLDWWTERNELSKFTLITDFVGGAAGPFSTVGWPGFFGAFSGVAKGRFAITLNAVISDEKPQIAPSIALTLREVFETAPSFDAAIEKLQTITLASDCLLLVTGTKPDERVVIERTSTRSALRTQIGGPLVVTNDYRMLEDTGWDGRDVGELHASTCTRFDRALYLASREAPSPEMCLALLKDPKVKMMITVQQMVLQASTGLLVVSLP